MIADDEPPSRALRDRLRELYQWVDEQVAAAAPVCIASGRCCRFAEYGHTLFLSGPEADLLVDEAPAPVRPLDDGRTCPWQDDRGLCRARDARPIGCRVYFCDPTFQDRSHEISEAALQTLKRLCDQSDADWRYATLHRHLREAARDGRFPGPEPSPAP